MNHDIKIFGDNNAPIIIGNNNTINGNKRTPKVLTAQVGLSSENNFIGRKEDLTKIHKLINENSILLIKGMGGIGKSTIASYYFNDKKDYFDYYGFIEIDKDTNIKENIISAFRYSLSLTSKDIDELFNEVINKLHNLEGKKFLVIDNISNIENQKKELDTIVTLKNSGFQILFTSRERIENIPLYPLKVMSIENARKLFFKYHPTTEINKVNKILKFLDYHTLFVELTAKTLTQKKYSLSLDKIIKEFTIGNFTKIKKDKTKSFKIFLCKLFEKDKILQDKETLLCLKRLSSLPSIGISFEQLYTLLGYDNKEELEENLIELEKNGWLIKYKDTYKFHQILKEFILEEHTPRIEEINELFQYFYKLFENSAEANTAISNINVLIYFDSLHQILKNYNFLEVIILYMNIGSVSKTLAIYHKASLYGRIAVKKIHILEKSVYFREKEKVTDREFLKSKSSIYNNLSQTYYYLGFYKKVYILDNKVLSIRKKTLGDNSIYTIQSYGNLAQLHFSCGNINGAKELFIKAINLIKDIKEDERDYRQMIITEKSTLYSNYASFLSKTNGNKNEALEYAEKSIELYKQEYSNKLSSELSTFEFNLAGIYEDNNRKKEAKYLYEKVLKDKIELFGKNHNDVATAYMYLALFLVKNETDFEMVKEYSYEALKIYKSVYPNEIHPRIALWYDNMGVIFNYGGNLINANIYALKALNLYEKLFGKTHYTTTISYYNVAISYYKLEQLNEAYFYIKKAVYNDKSFLEQEICKEILLRNYYQAYK